MPRLDRKQSFGALLETVTQQCLSQVASDALVELAKQLWYEERDLVPVLQREVAGKLRKPEQKLRALYLVDLLRRFPCGGDNMVAHRLVALRLVTTGVKVRGSQQLCGAVLCCCCCCCC